VFRVREAGLKEFASKAAEGVLGAFAGEVGQDLIERAGFVERASTSETGFGGVEMAFRVEKIGVRQGAEEKTGTKSGAEIINFLPWG
jgi:hypothetical protein